MTYLLCGCGGKNLPESFPAARCGRFFQKVLRFCVKLMDHVEELVEVSVQLLGGELRPPTYLVEREIAAGSSSASSSAEGFRLADVDPKNNFFRCHGVPLSILVAGSLVWYWPDDPVDIQKAAQSLIGRDVKKRFRRYVNNGSGGWFSGVIASYDEDTNLFLVVFEDGDRKVYDLNPNNDNIQVCPLHMCYDPSARLSMSSEDEGKRIQVFHAKDQQWIGGWVEAYDNVEGAHVIRFDDEDDRTGGQSPHFEGNLIIVDFNKAVQYRLLKDAEHADLRREERGLDKDTGKMQGHEENQVAATPSYVVRPKASANGPSTFLLANIETFLRDSGYVKIFSATEGVVCLFDATSVHQRVQHIYLYFCLPQRTSADRGRTRAHV